jgi:hypothetical protein
MGAELGSEIIARLKMRAGEPSRRTDTAAMAANSVGIGDVLGAQRANYASKSPEFQKEMREYLEGMNSPFAGMISNSVTGDGSQAGGLFGALSSLLGGKQMFAMGPGGQTIAMGAKTAPGEAPRPATTEAVTAAEAALGFELPTDLKSFYIEVANGGVGPGDGVYSLDELIAKWREMTDEPVGPRGQKWPKNLLPIHGDRWDLTCIDRGSGKLVYFDAEEIDYGGWSKAFKDEAESFEAWLQKWLDR